MKTAVIGLGRWGPNHVRVFSQIATSEVKYAVDPLATRRSRIEEAFPAIHCVDHYEKIIDDDSLDAVVISTPTESHYEIAKAFLESGKHVLCEKPLAASSSEAWALAALAGQRNLQLMVGHVFLFNPGILYLRQTLERKTAGAIYYLNAVRTNLGPFRSDVNAAWDLASHDVYIMNYLLSQRPSHVAATGASFLRRPVEDIVFLTLYYADGIMGHVHVSWLDPKKVRRITIVGEERMVTWDEYGTPGPVSVYDRKVHREPVYESFGEFQLLAREGDVVIPRITSQEPLTAQARAFLERCAMHKKDDRGSAEQGADVVDILEAVSRSLNENGQIVEVVYGG